MTKTIAAVLAGILLSLLTNLVSNYFVPMANKSKRLIWSIFAGLCVLTLLLAILSDQQVQHVQHATGFWISSLLRLRYGWLLILSAAVVFGTVLVRGLGRALRLVVAPPLEAEEKGYLQGVIKEMDRLNGLSSWKDDYYVETKSEVVEPVPTVTPSYYLVQKLNPGVKKTDFEALPNAEKVENSRGLTYNSFKQAARKATDNAVVVLSAPGGGKTVTLRRLAKEYAEERLNARSPTPILVNLSYYTGWHSPEEIEPFESFLESYFASGYTGWLADRNWEKLLQRGRCVFLLDGLDEIPRGTQEHQLRLKEVERFVRSWPNVKFYLSCRELDYDYRLGFQQILIKPFDLGRVVRFLKLYFRGRSDLYAVASQLKSVSSLYELAKVPFYLNLLCGYIRSRHSVPSNKSELFSFVIDRVIGREMARQGAEASTELGDKLIRMACDLSAEMSLGAMTSTLSLDAYVAGHPGTDEAEFRSFVQIGIRGGLLMVDSATSTVQFAHHRFQEFFCAYYITEHYHGASLDLPPDFFLSAWWRETILMVASIDPRPLDFVQMMMIDRPYEYGDDSGSVAATMRLAVLVLAHECLLTNKASKDSALATETRKKLAVLFPDETPMGKVAIVNALSEDSSPLATRLLADATKDRSQWVSEKAFFVRSSGAGRFRPTVWSAAKEFTRFLIAGRIFANAREVAVLAGRFKEIRWLMPLFAVFAGIGVAAVAAVTVVFFVIGKFLIFDLQYSMNENCLNCLANVSLTILALIFLLTRQHPWLQRFLITAPVALMCWFLVFNLPDGLVLKGLAFGLSVVFSTLIDRRWPAYRGGDGVPVATVSAFFVVSYSFDAFHGRLGEVGGPRLGAHTGTSLAVIFVGVLAALSWLLHDLLILRRTRRLQAFAVRILEVKGISSEAIDLLIPLFKRLGSAAWAQRALLDRVIARLAEDDRYDDADRLGFLLRLGTKLPQSPFRDVLYQRCEEVTDNFRRSLGRPTTTVLPDA